MLDHFLNELGYDKEVKLTEKIKQTIVRCVSGTRLNTFPEVWYSQH